MKSNWIAATVVTIRKNCAHPSFHMSHDGNLPGSNSFAATPVAALGIGCQHLGDRKKVFIVDPCVDLAIA